MDQSFENAIKTVKRHYFHGVDGKNWLLFRSVFTADATLDVSAATAPPAAVARGRDAIACYVRTAMEGITSIHRGYLRTLQSEATGKASAIWAMEDILFSGPAGALRKMLHGYGHYQETYRLEDGVWRCSSVVLTRVHVDTF